MAEYLSPGVYVEEVAGPKPIEGVSTSTAGVVGVTERGPLHTPQLVTSNGEFARVFGGTLPAAEFTDAGHTHHHLPHAVEAFFTNGGKRLWVTRVLPEGAAGARRTMMFADPAAATPGDTVLLRAAQQGSASAATPPALYALAPANFAVGDTVRIGQGSRSEYLQVQSIGAAARHVALDSPLRQGHAAGAAIVALAPAADDAAFPAAGQATFATVGDAAAGTAELVLEAGDVATLAGLLPDGSPAANWRLLQVGAAGVADFVFVRRAAAESATATRVWLARALQTDVPAGTAAIFVDTAGGSASTLAVPANVGDVLAYPAVSPLPAAFTTGSNAVIVDLGNDNQEAASIGQLATLPLSPPLQAAAAAGTLGQRVTLAADDRSVVAVQPGNQTVQLDDVGHLAPGMALTFSDGVAFETRFVDAIDTAAAEVTLRSALPWAPVGTVTLAAKALTAAAGPGAVALALDDRQGLEPGDVLVLGTDEVVAVRALPGERGPAPDAGAVLLERPLASAHAAGTPLRRQVVQVDPARQAVIVVLDAPAGAQALLVSNGTGFAAGDVLRLTLPDGSRAHARTGAAFAAAAPREITLAAPLAFSHAAGLPVLERQPLFDIQAIDPGAWGNRLLIGARDEAAGLAASTEVLNANPPPGPGMFSSLQLTSITGVEPGTVLEMHQPDGSAVPGLLKVRRVDRATRLALLDAPGLAAAHMAAVGAAALLGHRVRVQSREFALFVMLRRRPDPTTPSRDDELLDQEVFRNVSMDPRHSRYVERLVGITFTPGSDTDDAGEPVRRADRRSEGGSAYVRVRDLAAPAPSAAREAIRLGPEPLEDRLPSGLVRPARLALSLGDDQVPAMDDAMYVGADSNEPTRRTGLQTLRNLLTVSLVAVPGQTGALLQQAVIDHCELMRYRFAVLDGPAPHADTLVDVQNHRQQFDSSYAALYHPWPLIPDPYPASAAVARQLPVPPSGHVLGIYARSDNERGVHKAPANEVVRGITGLSRYFTKAEQDILNPYPVNINVIRDFRPQNRAIRVWGARCITSDGALKYVNVRRLLIRIEDSIERGTQWVVFEPNGPPLWSALRRAITDFLTTQWRDGALEGTKPEEGFFVKCDETTMTRDDIDNGRLVCVIGVAPVKPAEFVIFRIGLWTADAQR
ncbi:phage tail sheath C-terminal domain-containing protein [Aquincola sp. MAHUQ-54]|uniref:Phage tail sheath C-terminal domain-containing protein n=1 Tax=Aquincola agrisoli TaxID=3119538 RepID=A0AAW9Q8M5_9BURK